MTRYAKDTNVSVANSKAEIETIVARYGASGFMSGWNEDRAMIAFSMEGRQIRFVLSMPDRNDPEFRYYNRGSVTFEREPHVTAEKWEQACRQRWRALALVIKAKLEAVECGISEFDDEFMANIVLPDGRTVSEEIRPRIALAYESGKIQPLLPDYSGGA
jgi:hypothetical protein